MRGQIATQRVPTGTVPVCYTLIVLLLCLGLCPRMIQQPALIPECWILGNIVASALPGASPTPVWMGELVRTDPSEWVNLLLRSEWS